MSDYNEGRPGVYFFQHGAHDAFVNVYNGNNAMREGDYNLNSMWNNFGIHNDDMSSIVVFNDDNGTSYEVFLYEHDNFQGHMDTFTSNSSKTDTASHPSWAPQKGTWVGNGWSREYYGVTLLHMNDRVSSVKVRVISPPPPPPPPQMPEPYSEENRPTNEGTSGFYTRINGTDWNIDRIVRGGSNSSSKDIFVNTNGKHFQGNSNNTTGLQESTLQNYNFKEGNFSVDFMTNTRFHGRNRPDLGNYFGAPYGDYGAGTNRTLTIPGYCNRIVAICVGGGGGGGCASFGDNDGHGGGGGGSGGATSGFIDCNPGDIFVVNVGSGGHNGGREGGNGGGGGATTVTLGNKYIRAWGGGGGGGSGRGGGGGGGVAHESASILISKTGHGGSPGVNADDDDDEMNSHWEGYRAPGGGSIYNWTNTANGAGAGGSGGHFGDDDEFDGDCGDHGGGGWCRVYFIRKPQ